MPRPWIRRTCRNPRRRASSRYSRTTSRISFGRNGCRSIVSSIGISTGSSLTSRSFYLCDTLAMVLFNHATREITAKIVYYGPGLCGKTTNLMVIFDKLDPKQKGKMLSLATKTDRTLFFDLLPVDIGKVGNFNIKIQLYTVPGQVFYNETRKLVLKGADSIVFVADSQPAMIDANRESFGNLMDNLTE